MHFKIGSYKLNLVILFAFLLTSCDDPSIGKDQYINENVATNIDLTFKGYMTPSNRVDISSKNGGVLSYSLPEGARVKKGDVIFRLDDQSHKDYKFDLEIELKKLEATHEIQKIQSMNHITSFSRTLERARINFEIATLNFKDLDAGANKSDVKLSEEKLSNSILILESSKEELELNGQLVEEGFVSKDYLNELVYKIKKEAETVELFKKELELVKLGPDSISIQESKIKMNIQKRNFENLKKRKNHYQKVYDELLVTQKKQKERLVKKLKKVNKKIEDSVFLAPIDGTLLYCKWPWKVKILLGESVWSGVAIRAVANLKEMKASIRIPVKNLDNFKLGQKAQVFVPSVKKNYKGEIIKISQIQVDEFSQVRGETKDIIGEAGLKTVDVEVKINGYDSHFKPGLSVRIKITPLNPLLAKGL